MNTDKQYNEFAKEFSDSVSAPLVSRNEFYKTLGKDLSDKKLLDVACGDGVDLLYYQSLGAEVSGMDASDDLVKIAQSKIPNADLKVGMFENIPFLDNSFDIVVSKYAIQTTDNLQAALQEITRVTKRGGLIQYLTVHPLRQFVEKKGKFRDYYKQEKVDSVLFNGEMVVQEHSHTFAEYFSEDILKNLRLVSLYEGSDFADTSAQQVAGDYYPTFMICKFIKL
ncbi:MAG: class I SAM-dependent methyltransferase [Candidatus Pacearchaeota archaeon]